MKLTAALITFLFTVASAAPKLTEWKAPSECPDAQQMTVLLEKAFAEDKTHQRTFFGGIEKLDGGTYQSRLEESSATHKTARSFVSSQCLDAAEASVASAAMSMFDEPPSVRVSQTRQVAVAEQRFKFGMRVAGTLDVGIFKFVSPGLLVSAALEEKRFGTFLSLATFPEQPLALQNNATVYFSRPIVASLGGCFIPQISQRIRLGGCAAVTLQPILARTTGTVNAKELWLVSASAGASAFFRVLLFDQIAVQLNLGAEVMFPRPRYFLSDGLVFQTAPVVGRGDLGFHYTFR